MERLTREQKDYLHDLYYTRKNFRGRDALYNISKQENNYIPRDLIGEWLKHQRTAQLHQRQFKNKDITTITAKKPGNLQMDLIDYSNNPDNKYKYILTIIDIFTKQANAIPIRKKSTKNVIKAFLKSIELFDKIKVLQTDNGSEFINEDFQKLLRDKNIKHILSLPSKPQSNGVVERFNGTLKNYIQRNITFTGRKKWKNDIKKFIENYNNTPQKTIGVSPNSMDDTTKKDNIDKYLSSKKNRQIQKYQVGDYVRLKLEKGKLGKKSTINWTKKVYEIRRVIKPKNPWENYRYKVKSDLEEYRGSLNENELLKVPREPGFVSVVI